MPLRQQTKPVAELVREIRESKRVPLAVKRGQAMAQFRVEANLLSIIERLAEDSPLRPEWRLDLGALSLPCHDHGGIL